MKFTKGEWTTKGRYNTEGSVFAVNGKDERMVANCMGYSTNMDNGEHIEENKANAKLCAAAPFQHEKHEENILLCDVLLDFYLKGKFHEMLLTLSKIKSNSIYSIEKATK